MAQLDLRHILGLGLVDAEADHQVGHHLGLLLRLPDDADGLVDVQQNQLQALQEVELLPLLLQIVIGAAADALHPEGGPLLQKLPHPQHPGHAPNEHVEVAGKAVLQGGELKQLLHQLVRVGAPLQVDGDFQAVQTGLVPDVGNLLHLALLHQVDDPLHNHLDGGGGRDLGHVDAVLALVIGIAAAHPKAAPAGLVDLPHLLPVEEDLAAAGKVRGLHGGEQVRLGVPDQGDGGAAHLLQVEGADVAGHAHGNARVGVDQHTGEGGGQQGGLLHGAVVVVHKVHRVLVDILEQLPADGVQAGLCVPGGRPGHIPGVELAEVALRVHIGVQKGLVPPGEAHHRVIDGGVPVGVQLHGLAHNVGALGPGRA